jgi:hypothetical protein
MGLFVDEPLVFYPQQRKLLGRTKDTRSSDVTGQASSSANISTSSTMPIFILSTAVAHLNCVTSVV